MKIAIILGLTLIAMGLYGQSRPQLTCSEIVGDLYIQNAQLNQELAAIKGELTKLKEGK